MGRRCRRRCGGWGCCRHGWGGVGVSSCVVRSSQPRLVVRGVVVAAVAGASVLVSGVGVGVVVS